MKAHHTPKLTHRCIKSQILHISNRRTDPRLLQYCTRNVSHPVGEPRTTPQTIVTYPSTRGASNTPSRWQVPIHARRIRYIPHAAGQQKSYWNHRWTPYTGARYAPMSRTKPPHLPNTSQRRNTGISDTRGHTAPTLIPVEYYSLWTRSPHL
jgi:hypothetical protein